MVRCCISGPRFSVAGCADQQSHGLGLHRVASDAFRPLVTWRYTRVGSQLSRVSPAAQCLTPSCTPCFAAAPAKAEPSPEAQAALATLPPTERLLADVQAAFEAADVPMSDYTNLDAAGLACLLPPSVVARSTRLFLEEKIAQWACR